MLPLPILIALGVVLGYVVLSPAGPLGPAPPSPQPQPVPPMPSATPIATTPATSDAVPPFVSGFEHVWFGPEHWTGLQHTTPTSTPRPVRITRLNQLRAAAPALQHSAIAVARNIAARRP